MFLKEVFIRNYRSILEATLPCDNLTALVGPNGSGKSSFLNAIQLFYNPTAKVMREATTVGEVGCVGAGSEPENVMCNQLGAIGA